MLVGILVLGFLAGSTMFVVALAMAFPLWIAVLAYVAGGSIGTLLGAAALAFLPARRDRTSTLPATGMN